MTECCSKFTFICLITASLLACSASGENTDSPPVPVDNEIADVRNLPQDVGAYASLFRDGSLGKICRDYYLSQFRRKYYSPWSGNTSITDITASVATMKEHLQKEWYGENKRRVPENLLEELSGNCDLEHFPSMKRPAIATAATDVRVLPTTRPFFENADDFPFDALQNTALKLNEPIRVLHVSMDGLWLFVEAADTNGWVQTRDIGFMDDIPAKKWMDRAQVVIVRDFTLIRDKSGLADQRVNVGTICPLVGEKGDAFEISVAIKAGKHRAREIKAKVAKAEAAVFPLEFNRGSIPLIGNELISKPYGWGEKFQDRDCSSMLRDFYLPFGIWLPRGSYNQIHSAKNISLAGLSGSEKGRLIMENGVPFLTLVHLKGHIMLYVGNRNGRPLMFHSIWGIGVRDGKGGEYKKVIGKSIVSTLNPGAELDLASASLLERVDSMLVLGDRNTCAGK
jgi:hypothetical protein